MSKGNLIRTPHSEVTALLEALDRYGVSPQDLTASRGDDRRIEKAALALLGSGLGTETISPRLARHWMGNQLFSLQEWKQFFAPHTEEKYRFSVTPELREKAEVFPWREDVLLSPCPFTPGKTIRETHLAFYGLGSVNGQLTDLRWWYFDNEASQSSLLSGLRWRTASKSHAYTKETCGSRWYLMPMDPVKFIPNEYRQTTAIEEMTKGIIQASQFAKFLPEEMWVETASLSDEDHQISPKTVYVRCEGLGYCVAHGLQGRIVGKGVSRKLPETTSP